jgi:hypothetical protein
MNSFQTTTTDEQQASTGIPVLPVYDEENSWDQGSSHALTRRDSFVYVSGHQVRNNADAYAQTLFTSEVRINQTREPAIKFYRWLHRAAAATLATTATTTTATAPTLATAATAPEPPKRKRIADLLSDIMGDVPQEVFAALPADGASEHDHYLYGTPKRNK